MLWTNEQPAAKCTDNKGFGHKMPTMSKVFLPKK